MVETVGIAVIGAGAIGRTHVETLARVPGVRLSALVDPAAEAAGLAASAGVPHLSDMPALIASGLAQAAIVATPNETHLPISETLLRAGIPVLLEKPVAESLASALRLITVADETGVPVLVGHHRRHNPIVQAARQALHAGRIGDLMIASVMCSLAKPDSYFSARWRRMRGAGGPLLINLVHEIDLLRHFFGEIASVQALSSHARRRFEVEDSAAVCLEFEAGGIASLIISDAAVGPWAWDLTSGENLARFPAHKATAHHYAGTAGALSLPDLKLWRPQAAPDWTQELRPEALSVSHGDAYEAQLVHFADLVRGSETSPRVSLRDGAANLIVLDAILEAAQSGRAIKVDLSPLENPAAGRLDVGAGA